MCTAAIQSAAAGQLVVASNRDELRTRRAGLGPAIHELGGGLSAIWPQDADAGGTWIGVNTAGLAATLLNNYPADAARLAPAQPVSRGELVPAMLARHTLAGARAELEGLRARLGRYRPFWLLVAWAPADEEASGFKATWDGASLALEALALPAAQISSSVDYERVEAARRAQLAPLLAASQRWTPGALDRVFGGHAPYKGPASVCMHRDDAATVSHTRIEVGPERVALTYYDGPLCERPSAHRLDLPRSIAPR